MTNLIPSFTSVEHTEALTLVLGERMMVAIQGRPSQARAAIYEIFMHRLEDKPEFRDACLIIRSAEKILQDVGAYQFAE